MNWMWDHLGDLVLAAGALGTAAFGIVEGLKRWRFLGEAGFAVIIRVLGPIVDTLKAAYGPDVETLLRAQYRGSQDEFARILRQGARIGLTRDNAAAVAATLAIVDAGLLQQAAAAVDAGQELPANLRNVLGRYELAVDARIDAALTLAQAHYAAAARIGASMVAIVIALTVGFFYTTEPRERGLALLVGLAAVPLAPIAKDVVSALKATVDALRARLP
jgi:hypothetical protein